MSGRRWVDEFYLNDEDIKTVKIEVTQEHLRKMLSGGKRQLRKIYTMIYEDGFYRYGGKRIASNQFDEMCSRGEIKILRE